MSIPIHLQQFKAAGVYRVVFDKSTIVNYDTELLRLVVGYSEQGPFNIPVYVKDPQTFTAMFGGINKKLERRGVYFHRLALQMLNVSPILVLNLKKFNNETVGGVSINSDFNPSFDPINTVELKVEDIYDTTRFWELNAERLNDLTDVNGQPMDQYINICTTNTKKTSASIFIRKASGLKVSGYDITVNDWYSDNPALIPDFLENARAKNTLISDYFAEVYVFDGQFTAKQVLASDTLKNYFDVKDTGEVDNNGDQIFKLTLKPYILNAFGDPTDTLDALFNDSTSNPIGHYIGSLIPEFKTKNNTYAALDVLFNTDQASHNMMMSFNVDMLYEDETGNVDLSGRLQIPTEYGIERKKVADRGITLDKLFINKQIFDEDGNVIEDKRALSTVLGNKKAPVVTDILSLSTNATQVIDGKTSPLIFFQPGRNSVRGKMYVNKVESDGTTGIVELYQVLEKTENDEPIAITIKYNLAELAEKKLDFKTVVASKFGVVFTNDEENDFTFKQGQGTGWNTVDGFAYEEPTTDTEGGNSNLEIRGPERIISNISFIEPTEDDNQYTDIDNNIKVNFLDVQIETTIKTSRDSVYGSSVSFIDYDENNWQWTNEFELVDGVKQAAMVSNEYWDHTLNQLLQKGDCLLAADNTVDYDENGEHDDMDYYYDAVYVTETGTKYDNDGNFVCHYVLFSGQPYSYEDPDALKYNEYLVRIDGALNQEIGEMEPIYLEGYTYEMARPTGNGMWAKQQWQREILSALNVYKGLRTGLLNKSEIDYRYVIDTFESFPDSSIKNELSFLCKQKQSAFCIANFPSVQTFTKCPYASFTDNKRLFNVEYVVKGCNRKKASSISFSLPDDGEGGSFVAFYSPLKFSDGYIDNIVPSAGLVSNLFIEKYMTRQPYYIVAGPNYGRIAASGLVGPDYKYSQDELHIIEPFGVNCMVYRPNFGTFINANQTAKQAPLSALSKVHVRELVIYLQDEIEKVLQSYQWEFNNQTTRNAILARANDICSRVMSNGGLQAYLNIMDESNNTPEIIDNEMAVLSTHIEPGMGCGKMVHELTLYRTGRMMATINEGV